MIYNLSIFSQLNNNIEISRVRLNLFQMGSKESSILPEPVGATVVLTEKLYVPVKDHPDVLIY